MSDLTTVVAAVPALLFVHKLTAMQHLKATQGPVAHVRGPPPGRSGTRVRGCRERPAGR
ncbi:hypothetical protein AB0D46_37620 [Streptomyces sp. NPDC048383]|uniref:hypothetical protein n=1 Tax=Streptomyces sp. NPDC048383 TaxID=3155386 RepID=UPI0034297B24